MSLPESTDTDLWISWEQYHRLIEQLALKVYKSGWKFDQILSLARGGVRVGDVLSRIFEVPLGILATSSYREAAGTVQGQLDIAKFITITKGMVGGRVLLVDDMVDSGLTFKRVYEHLLKEYQGITEMKSAVLWWKGRSTVEPDYYIDYLPTNPWIHQPFEDYDSLRPHQLESWLKRGVQKS